MRNARVPIGKSDQKGGGASEEALSSDRGEFFLYKKRGRGSLRERARGKKTAVEKKVRHWKENQLIPSESAGS